VMTGVTFSDGLWPGKPVLHLVSGYGLNDRCYI